MIHNPPLRIGLTFLVLVLAACRFSRAPDAPLPLSQRIGWDGKAASRYSDSVPAADTSGDEAPVRFHFLEFAGSDTLRLCLRQYRNAYDAYAAFQNSATREELAQGYYRERNALVFAQGIYLGEAEYARAGLLPAEFLKQKLVFQGEELFAKPDAFAAFPLLGRIQHSERVIPKHFLGRNWHGPVFTVSYRCNSDTATAFRAFAQPSDSVKTWMRDWQGKKDTLDWGREIHFQGLDEFRRPLIFWLFSDGVMGFAGCFDSALAGEYAEKLQKTAVLWPKP